MICRKFKIKGPDTEGVRADIRSMEEERKQIEKRVERAETKSKALSNYDPLYQAAKKLRIEKQKSEEIQMQIRNIFQKKTFKNIPQKFMVPRNSSDDVKSSFFYELDLWSDKSDAGHHFFRLITLTHGGWNLIHSGKFILDK